jgi:hypothetical protein
VDPRALMAVPPACSDPQPIGAPPRTATVEDSVIKRLGLRPHPKARFALATLLWIAVAVWVIWADFLADLEIAFPVTYILPVLFAANSGARSIGLGLSVAMPLARLQFDYLSGRASAQDPLASCMIQIFVLGLITVLVDRARRELQVLRGLLPICAWCRRIQVDGHTWLPLESYVAQHVDARLSHGLCPACHDTHFGQHTADSHRSDVSGQPSAITGQLSEVRSGR